MDIFGTLIARPFGWVFWAILQVINNYGIAIIFFTVIVKILLYPLQYKSKKGMLGQQRLQPKLKELEQKCKGDRNLYNTEVQKLYTENGVSPMSGCLPMLLLLPVMFGLYRVIREPIKYVLGLSSQTTTSIMEGIKSVAAPGSEALKHMTDMLSGAEAINEITILRYVNLLGDKIGDYKGLMDINMSFLGLDLTQIPSVAFEWLILLPIISGITAFLQSYITQDLQVKLTGVQPAAGASNKMLLYSMPLVSVFIGFTLPAGLTLYWIANSVLGIAQEYILQAQMTKIWKKLEAEDKAAAERKMAQREEAKQANREIQKKNAGNPKKETKKPTKTYKLSRPSKSDDDE